MDTVCASLGDEGKHPRDSGLGVSAAESQAPHVGTSTTCGQSN